LSNGHIRKTTRVDGLILGDRIETGEENDRSEGDKIKIAPLLYDTILYRAEKRLLNLNSKIQDAPFLVTQQEELKRFVEPIAVVQGTLLS
jgi:hypothetical protein